MGQVVKLIGTRVYYTRVPFKKKKKITCLELECSKLEFAKLELHVVYIYIYIYIYSTLGLFQLNLEFTKLDFGLELEFAKFEFQKQST